MIWYSTASGHIGYASPEWTAFTGQPQSEALGNGWLNYVHPDDVASTKNSFREALALHVPFMIRYRLKHIEFKYVDVVVAATSSFSPLDGSFIGYIGTVTEAESLGGAAPPTNVIGFSTFLAPGVLTTPASPLDRIADYLLMARSVAVSEDQERMLASLDFALSEIVRLIGKDIHSTVQ